MAASLLRRADVVVLQYDPPACAAVPPRSSSSGSPRPHPRPPRAQPRS